MCTLALFPVTFVHRFSPFAKKRNYREEKTERTLLAFLGASGRKYFLFFVLFFFFILFFLRLPRKVMNELICFLVIIIESTHQSWEKRGACSCSILVPCFPPWQLLVWRLSSGLVFLDLFLHQVCSTFRLRKCFFQSIQIMGRIRKQEKKYVIRDGVDDDDSGLLEGCFFYIYFLQHRKEFCPAVLYVFLNFIQFLFLIKKIKVRKEIQSFFYSVCIKVVNSYMYVCKETGGGGQPKEYAYFLFKAKTAKK